MFSDIIEEAYREYVPRYISPGDFWNLSVSELRLIPRNIAQKNWDFAYILAAANKALAHDISLVFAGKPLESLSELQALNPRNSAERSIKEIEMTLFQWSKEGE